MKYKVASEEQVNYFAINTMELNRIYCASESPSAAVYLYQPLSGAEK
jgi:hypothetical protein